jgi:mannose-6-phosphate isomerase-like protein (cupin superfamily)
MTYPPIRYTAPIGTTSATFRPAATPPDLVGDRTEIGYLATALSTDGEFGLYHYAMTALPSGPDPHFHRTMSESFYVLSGTVRLYDGTGWVDATAGDYLYVPPGGIHAFRNASGQPAAMLLLFAPGAPRERYFEELAKRAAAGLTFRDDTERVAFLHRHDQYEAPYADPAHRPPS